VSSSSQIAFGYLIGIQESSLIEVMAALTLGFIRAVTENQIWWRIAVPTNAWP